MSCHVIKLKDGSTMIACSRGRQPKPKCYICGKPADLLCDYVLEIGLKNPTCDRPLCSEHRVKIANDIDYCPEHWKLTQKIRSGDTAGLPPGYVWLKEGSPGSGRYA